MGHEDLGNHFYASGDLVNAFKSYSRMRDFCTAPKHILDMSLQIIRVCIEQGNYMSVQSHIVKIRNLSRTPEEEEALKPKLCVAMGLTQLASGAFRDAAKSFLECPPTLGASYNDVISSNDVAIYGGLCALASMERGQLKKEVLDNNDFRNFLELEPQMRKAISYFHTAKYSNCLQILEEYKNDYHLDIHLQKHVNKLYEMIRSKGIVQYFIPFSCVTLASMAEAFATSEKTLEKELVGMIGRGILDARIDTKNRVSLSLISYFYYYYCYYYFSCNEWLTSNCLVQLLTAKEADLRTTVHRDTLVMAQNYERTTRMRLMRMNIIRAGLEVRGPKGGPNLPPGVAGQGGQGWVGHTGRTQGFMERFHMGS